MPEKLKHKCPDCHLNKWIIDYKEGCASKLTRSSTCLFCQQAKEIDKMKKENLELKNNIKELFSAIKELRMSNQNLNEEVIENGRDIHDIRTKLTCKTSDNIETRPIEEIENVRNQREEPFTKVTGKRLATKKPKHQPKLETPINNRFSPLSEVEEETVLIGDSMVRGQGKYFGARNPKKRQVQSYPGARASDIKKAVGKLKPKSNKATIIVQASGNDLYLRNGNVGETEPVVKQLASTVEAVREKTENGIMIGLLPRANISHYALSKAIGINTRLEQLCKQKGVRFLNLWDEYTSNRKLYHFSEQGKRIFGNILNENVAKLLQSANHRGCTSDSAREKEVVTARTAETKIQGNM